LEKSGTMGERIGIFLTLLAKYQIYSSPKVLKKDRFGEK
jgi:hypothetical protein